MTTIPGTPLPAPLVTHAIAAASTLTATWTVGRPLYSHTTTPVPGPGFQLGDERADNEHMTLAASGGSGAAARPLRTQVLRGAAFAALVIGVGAGGIRVWTAVSNAEHHSQLAHQQQVASQEIFAADGLHDECDSQVTATCAQHAATDVGLPVAWIGKTPQGWTQGGGLVVTVGDKYRVPNPDQVGYTSFAASTGFATHAFVKQVELFTQPRGVTVVPGPHFPVVASAAVGTDNAIIRQVSPHSLWAEWTHANVVYVLIASDGSGQPPLQLVEDLLPQVRYAVP